MDDITLTFILSHWAFAVVSLALGVTGSVVKLAVLGPVKQDVYKSWRHWYRLTLPLHAMFAGALVGSMPFMPCPEEMCGDATSKVLYYGAAGILSTFVYDLVQHITKTRLGPDYGK